MLQKIRRTVIDEPGHTTDNLESLRASFHFFCQKHAHPPERLHTEGRYRRRIKRLPEKYLFAILAGEIASSMVYRENREAVFLAVLQSYLQRSFEDQVELNIDKG